MDMPQCCLDEAQGMTTSRGIFGMSRMNFRIFHPLAFASMINAKTILLKKEKALNKKKFLSLLNGPFNFSRLPSFLLLRART